MAVFIFIAFLFMLVMGAALLAMYTTTRPHDALDRSGKRELKRLQNLIYRIDQLAYSNRDVNPELSIQIIDEIHKHRQNSNAPEELG